MKIDTGFRLNVPVEQAWPLLTDLERVAPSMPGVAVQSIDDEGLHATMRVKVGPITASYRTLVEVVSLDEAAHTAVLRASGRETRGQGTVQATVTATMRGEDGATAVELSTELAVTGKVAQFGGSVMTEVADRLLRQFAERLEADLTTQPSPAQPDGAATPAPRPEPEPVDLGRLAGGAMVLEARRTLAAVVLALLALVALRRRRR